MAAGQVHVVLDGAKIAEMMRSPTGPVYRFLVERGEIVRQAAKRNAPHKTGCLEGSIVKRIEVRDTGLVCRIIADTTPCSPTRESYALYVEEGTKPHRIEGNPTLAFFWPHGPNGPGMYFFSAVNHPGTKATHFLKRALPLAAP